MVATWTADTELRCAELALRDDTAAITVRRHALGVLLHVALTHPGSLSPSTLAAIAVGLRLESGQEEVCELALAALAAMTYARPDLLRASLLDRLDTLLQMRSLPSAIGAGVRSAFECLAVSDVAAQAWARLLHILPRESLDAGVRELLMPLLRFYTHWRPDLVTLDAMLTLAGAPTMTGHRNFVLDYVVERFAFTAPEIFTEETVDRLTACFGTAPRYRYFLHTLGTRTAVRPAVKRRIAVLLANAFPLRKVVAPLLCERPFKFLVVVNARLGQGDEITRLVPLLQTLLDANTSLSIALVTRRPYLYDNPRVHPTSILDERAVAAVLEQRCDGVVDIFEPAVAEMAWRPALEASLQRYITAQHPGLVIKGDVGHNHFVYQTVALGGRDVARQYGFDQRVLENIYEPCLRLMAEFGLTQRAAEEVPRTPSLLVGLPSVDAEEVWRELAGERGGHAGAARRPIALVNAFGGAKPLKGYVASRCHVLAGEVTGLVREGYRVILLPNGTPWGGPGPLAHTLSYLSSESRSHVTMAPDPSATDEAVRLRLSEWPGLPYADRVMRLFKYFATYADLVVTVEGWLLHLAYNLGRPLRFILMTQSFPFDWHPHGLGRHQRLVTRLSTAAEAPYWATELLGETDPSPLPPWPRKGLLQAALAGLGLGGEPAAVTLLRRAMASADWEIRAAAVAALGRVRPLARVKTLLVAALQDRERTVRLRAAEALLHGEVDCSRELGARYQEHLQAYCEIARQHWAAVVKLGSAALPALAIAAEDENEIIRRETRWVLRRLLPAYPTAFAGRASTVQEEEKPQ
jgi:hypothetical protein